MEVAVGAGASRACQCRSAESCSCAVASLAGLLRGPAAGPASPQVVGEVACQTATGWAARWGRHAGGRVLSAEEGGQAVEARSLWAGCAHTQPGGSRGHVAGSWLVVVVVAIWACVYRGRQLWQQRADQIDCLSHAGPGAGAAKARVAGRNWGRRGPLRVHSGVAGVGIVVKER